MELQYEMRPDAITIVQVSGRLDLLSAADAKRQITRLIAEGHRRLIVSLAEITFIDSSGLGALIGCLKAARLAGGDLRIAHSTEQAKVILKLTTLNRVLRPYDTIEEALVGYEQGSAR